MPGWPNQLKYVAKNLYHLTIIAHPTTVLALHMVAAARYFVQNNAPFRVGVIFVDEEAADTVPASVSGKEVKEEEDEEDASKASGDAVWPTDLLPAASWAEFMPPAAAASKASKSTTKSASSSSASSSGTSSSSSSPSSSAASSGGGSATHHPLPTLMAAAFRYLAEVHAATTAFAFLDSFKHEHVSAKLDEPTVRR